MIYLDNAATTIQKPRQVYQAVWETMTKNAASPGRGGYGASLAASEAMFAARENIADFFHIPDPTRLIFTQNTTHGLNIAIKGALSRGDHVIYSSMEHNSVVRPIKALEDKRMITTSVLKANKNGEIDVNQLSSLIRPNTRLICLTHSSNVCGNITDIYAAARIAKERKVLLLVDAAQSAGTLDIDATQIDLLAFPGHKGIMGPFGSGGLYIAESVSLSSFSEGGTGSLSESLKQPDFLPDRFESGTQNSPAMIGMSSAVSFLKQVGTDAVFAHESALCRHFDEAVQNMKGVSLLGGPNKTAISALVFRGIDCNEVSRLLDERYGICTRSGLHCAIMAHQTLGTADTGCVRFSFGFFNTIQEVNRAIDAVYAITKELGE